MSSTEKGYAPRRKRGFERASVLAAKRIRKGGETRGFAVSRVLTHWTEIVGPDLADMARPVDVKYGRGLGATLTVLTSGAQAPMLEMQKDKIRDRVNACYGYAAIQKVRITQTAAIGFEEKKAPPRREIEGPKVRLSKSDVENDGLRAALERLGTNIATHDKR